jgi:hypothetical protein
MSDDSSNRADGTEDASFTTRSEEVSKELSDESGEEAMKRTGMTTRRGTLDELDIHLLTNLEERDDRLYAILSKTTRYRNILGGEIKKLRAGSAPEMIRPLVAQWDHLRREIKRLAQEL